VFLLKKTAIVQLLLTKFESTKITKKGQPILGQDKNPAIIKVRAEKPTHKQHIYFFPNAQCQRSKK
jgi:hypothetical protein